MTSPEYSASGMSVSPGSRVAILRRNQANLADVAGADLRDLRGIDRERGVARLLRDDLPDDLRDGRRNSMTAPWRRSNSPSG